jgi:hypothetical protein
MRWEAVETAKRFSGRGKNPLENRQKILVESEMRMRKTRTDFEGRILRHSVGCFLFVVLAFLGNGTLCAQFSWSQRSQEFNPSVTDTNVVVRFPFKNTGSQAVTISNVTSSCTDCTTADLVKRTYSTGESGEIVASFRFGERVGTHEKTIVVESNDPKEPKAELKFKVNIPEILKVSPGFVFWLRDGEKTTKTINVKVVHSEAVNIEWVRPGHPKLQAELETVREGWEYNIKITPTDTSRPVRGMVRIETDFPVERIRTVYVYAYVK